MKAVLKFGDFRLYDFPIQEGFEFQEVHLPHPLGLDTVVSPMDDVESDIPDVPGPPIMRFAFVKRLDRNLLEYQFCGEY